MGEVAAVKFVYVGKLTKADGTVDVIIPTDKLKVRKTFRGVYPNETIIEVDNERAIAALRGAKDFEGNLLYREIG